MREATLAWLAFLVEQLAGTAILLLVTQRPGYQPPWRTHAAVTQLAFPPWRAEDSGAVLQAVPGPRNCRKPCASSSSHTGQAIPSLWRS